MKKFLIVLFTLLCLTVNVCADDKARIFDNADLLSTSEEESLNSKLASVSDKYGIDVVIVTTNSNNRKSVMAFADDFYDNNGFKKDGIILVVSMETYEWHISTSGLMSEKISDNMIDNMANHFMSYLNNGNYYSAFTSFISDVDYYASYTPQTPQAPKPNIVISIVGGLLAALITMAILKGQLKSVRKAYYAQEYVIPGSFVMTGYSDMFINSHVNRTPRPRQTNGGPGGGNGGGHSTHVSSSGNSHGGHGGHFK